MKIDIQPKIEEYVRLLDQIKEKFGEGDDSLTILQEIRKDIRTSYIRQQKGHYYQFPATEKQIAYLKALGMAIHEGLTSNQASTLIEKTKAAKNQHSKETQKPEVDVVKTPVQLI